MVTIIALAVSIILQFTAAIVAISLTKVTRYNISWILISIALFFMAIRRLIELVPFLYRKFYDDIQVVDHWLGVATSVLVAIGIFFVRKIFNQLREAERIRKHSERRILNAIIRTEEREKQRFAKELHDGLGPIMSTIKMSLTAIPRANLDEHGQAVVSNLESVIDQGITEIKEISNNLSPHVLTNFGLESAISSFINKINYAGGIHIDFNSNLTTERFGLTVESVLYRTTCELINNTIKHAMADHIELKLSKVNNMLFMHYADNGIGFIYDNLKNNENKGMGYYNIYSRLQSINGQMDVDTAPGKSFVADICVRLN